MFIYVTSQLKSLIFPVISTALPLILVAPNVLAQSNPGFKKQDITVVARVDNSSTKKPSQNPKYPIFLGQKDSNEADVPDRDREYSDEVDVPVGNQEVISDIVVRFMDEDGNIIQGKTKPDIIKQEFELQPGDVYRADLATEGLNRVIDFIIERASLSLEKEGKSKQVVMAISVQEKSNLAVGFDLPLPPPTALQGLVRIPAVNALSDIPDFAVGAQVGLRNLGGTNQGVNLGVEGGPQTLGINLGYRKYLRHDRGFGFNFFNRRGVEPEFDEGNPDIDLDNGEDPWVDRLGAGIEYFRPIGKDWNSALGLSYQQVSVRDGAFSSNIESRDELGNRLTVSDSGQDDLLTLNFATVLNRQDNPFIPTRGYKFQFSSDQYFPIGEADVLANRLAANYTHYFPLPLFGFTEGPKTLVFNFQGGTILGDAIPYDSFILGGANSVRGYGISEVSTARSFIQASAEYRFPVLNINAFNQTLPINGALFVDYATDLGSADAVIGEPAVVRDRPGDGLGYGLGLQTLTPFGTMRTEFAFNEQGDTKFIFEIGDRF